MNKKLRMVLYCFVAWVLLHSIYICIDGLKDEVSPSDCILILGNTVNTDGTLSSRLQSRVDKGFELYSKKFAPYIIVSGGLGKEGYYEAREMKKYLLGKGIPDSSILVDDEALTTYHTMKNYVPIATKHSFHSVVVVSQYFHLTRSRSMLRSLGIEKVSTAHSDYFELRDIYAVAREFVAYYGFRIKNLFGMNR